MNEVDFILRRILKEAREFANKDFEDSRNVKQPNALSLVAFNARLQLIDHLQKTFTKEEN